ncbi:ATP-dependent zinc metalloprotease FtsH, partial [candidate division WWE3 bacterium]|nr:ATP-dependent zinc metalloprotease FtsH [candidate division WWE3 bacterium]
MPKNSNEKKSERRSAKTPLNNKKVVRTPNLLNNIFFYVFLVIIIYSVVSSISGSVNPKAAQEMKPISEVLKQIDAGNVQNIKIAGSKIDIQLKDGTEFKSSKEEGISFDEILTNNKIDRSKIAGEVKISSDVSWLDILTPILSFAFPLLLLFFIFRQMRGAGGDIASFGQSRARIFSKDSVSITFKDVAGAGEAKRELLEIVDFLKNPDKYRKLGARIPKGVLLVGASGVGKTLLAKAIAGEAGVPFFSVAGSEFMEMLVGVGSARARDLFLKAKEAQPSLIFIDEIDAIGRQRGMGIGGGHDEREQTLNQILIEMDGFDTRINVIVIAATNRPDMLDPALVRPGRFDRKITVPMPDLTDREEIIKIHMLGKPIADDVSVEKLAKRTVGFSGADIENMVNEAAILAARENKEQVFEADLEEASLKVTMGSERKTIQTEDERKMVAYHEAGHGLVASK